MDRAYLVLDLYTWSLWCRQCPWRGSALDLALVRQAYRAHDCSDSPVCYPVRLHRCSCCGRTGLRNFRPANPNMPLAWVRTWICVDRDSCKQRMGPPC
jgi:hypothetical protein